MFEDVYFDWYQSVYLSPYSVIIVKRPCLRVAHIHMYVCMYSFLWAFLRTSLTKVTYGYLRSAMNKGTYAHTYICLCFSALLLYICCSWPKVLSASVFHYVSIIWSLVVYLYTWLPHYWFSELALHFVPNFFVINFCCDLDWFFPSRISSPERLYVLSSLKLCCDWYTYLALVWLATLFSSRNHLLLDTCLLDTYLHLKLCKEKEYHM